MEDYIKRFDALKIIDDKIDKLNQENDRGNGNYYLKALNDYAIDTLNDVYVDIDELEGKMLKEGKNGSD